MFFTKTSVARCIVKEYKALGLEPGIKDYWVLDQRTGQLLGPFELRSTSNAAEALNDFVAKNGYVITPFSAHLANGEIL